MSNETAPGARTTDLVPAAALKMMSQGVVPSPKGIRELIGKGSYTTINESLAQFMRDSSKLLHPDTAIPEPLVVALREFWTLAMVLADGRHASEREQLAERFEAQSAEIRDAGEKNAVLERQLGAEQSINQGLVKENGDLLLACRTHEVRATEARQAHEVECSELRSNIARLEEQLAAATVLQARSEKAHAEELARLNEACARRVEQEVERSTASENRLFMRIATLEEAAKGTAAAALEAGKQLSALSHQKNAAIAEAERLGNHVNKERSRYEDASRQLDEAERKSALLEGQLLQAAEHNKELRRANERLAAKAQPKLGERT